MLPRKKSQIALLLAALAIGEVTLATGNFFPAEANPTPSSGASAVPLNQTACELAASYSAGYNGVSTLVVKDGKIVYENYQNGSTPDDAYELASGTKSFSGVAAVAAQEDGLLSLDEKVSDTITEWKNDPARKDITIYELLHLTAGLQGNPGNPPTYEEAISAPVLGKPGEKFKYGPPSFQVFGELLRRKLNNGDTIQEYLQKRIFDPIDLKVTGWKEGADGMPLLPQGAQLTARNWAKFGQLILQGGVYDGKRILKEESVALLKEPTKANPMYGLTWWLNRQIDPALRSTIVPLTASSDIEFGANGVPDDLFMAAGAGGQRLYIVPSQNLVVVRQANKIVLSLLRKKHKYSDKEFLKRLFTGQATPGSDSRSAANLASGAGSDMDPEQVGRFRKKLLNKFDANGDGKIDRSERKLFWEQLRSRRNQ